MKTRTKNKRTISILICQ